MQNLNGDTPLHVAIHVGSADLVELLLEYGADPSIQNESGETPYDRGNTIDILRIN